MSSAVLASVDRHTRLAGHNRLALLLFGLAGSARYGINVFKVREVLRCPPLAPLPAMRPQVRGAVQYRGREIAVIDLQAAIGADVPADPTRGHLLVTEFNGGLHGFLIGSVDRIVHVDVAGVETPAPGLDAGARISAVTRIEGALIGIVDVEQILANAQPPADAMPADAPIRARLATLSARRVLVADDSALARRQIRDVIIALGLECELAIDGRDALARLRAADRAGAGHVLLVSDIEMPGLDGYALTRAVRADPALSGLPVLLHSSLSGVFNERLVTEVGANRFLAKFQPRALAEAIAAMVMPPG